MPPTRSISSLSTVRIYLFFYKLVDLQCYVSSIVIVWAQQHSCVYPRWMHVGTGNPWTVCKCLNISASLLFSLVAQMVKNLPALQEFDPWVRKVPWEGKGNPLQYSCLENCMDWEAWRATVHGIAKSRTRLSDLHFHFALPFSGEESLVFISFSMESLISKRKWKSALVWPSARWT